MKWGVVATGGIAHEMAAALTAVTGAELVAVASRTQASADAFAKRWRIPHAYPRYEALAADPAVDIAYIATPHPMHLAPTLACLAAGKHVLCEKPLTMNARDTTAAVEAARAQGRFLMEAIWMRFLPAIRRICELVSAGAIGDIRHISADFSIHPPYDPAHRLFNPELGGGALLDLGIYPLSFTTMLLGQPQEISGRALIGETGVDEGIALTLTYPRALAQLTASSRVQSAGRATILGTAGRIEIERDFFKARGFTLTQGAAATRIDLPPSGNGYAHEVIEVHRCIAAGLIDPPLLPHHESIATAACMDQLLQTWHNPK